MQRICSTGNWSVNSVYKKSAMIRRRRRQTEGSFTVPKTLSAITKILINHRNKVLSIVRENFLPEVSPSHTGTNSRQTPDYYNEESREERKRKRRSRWGDPETKVPVSSLQPGMAIPAQIGQPAVMIPPPKMQTGGKVNPMLTKISRGDPALVQYARQTFGTLDLSEEQWRKAEDHYKVSLRQFRR